MRTAFLLLVLANLGFFAWWRYGAQPAVLTDPAPLSREVRPDRLRILSEAELARALPKPKPGPVQAAPTPPAPEPARPTVPVPALACIEWGSFTLADAPRAEKVLVPLNLGTRLSARQVEETANWWVFMPPQGNRAGAIRKANELRNLGITEFYIVTEAGPLRWSISLGIFRNEDAAQEHLAALRRLGVRTGRVGPRTLQVPKTWLRIDAADAALAARMKEIAIAFPGSELRDCAQPPGPPSP